MKKSFTPQGSSLGLPLLGPIKSIFLGLILITTEQTEMCPRVGVGWVFNRVLLAQIVLNWLHERLNHQTLVCRDELTPCVKTDHKRGELA